MFSRTLATKNTSVESAYLLVWGWIRSAWNRWVSFYLLLESIRSERHTLTQMTDAELRDLGIHRADADHESARGYFDVPVDRQRPFG